MFNSSTRKLIYFPVFAVHIFLLFENTVIFILVETWKLMNILTPSFALLTDRLHHLPQNPK
jgi:hypothetical protein